MDRRIDLTGQKFSRLTVIEFSHIDKGGAARWKCKCTCGNETIVTGYNLRNGLTKSCGCLRGGRLELTGRRFGRLTVIEFSHVDKWKQACWKCKCDCGNETTVKSTNLKSGDIKSCGCLRKEMTRKARQLPEGEAARNVQINNHKRDARRRNLEQALTDKQIIALHKQNCYYCDAPPSNAYSRSDLNGAYTYNGIDRVDNTKGYTMDNSVSCCKICNRFKSDLPLDKFLDHIKRIHSYLNLDA